MMNATTIPSISAAPNLETGREDATVRSSGSV